ncbi:MAG: hypothetical protein ACERKZ_20525 [Lachnotalea sp.]
MVVVNDYYLEKEKEKVGEEVVVIGGGLAGCEAASSFVCNVNYMKFYNVLIKKINGMDEFKKHLTYKIFLIQYIKSICQ